MRSNLFCGVMLCVGLSSVANAETPLQKHVRFFDRDGDGQISMSETYAGFRALGFGIFTSGKSSFLINGLLGPKTSSSWWTLFSIDINNIHIGKHGSDTGIYDAQGNLVLARLDKMFELYDTDHDKAISEAELASMLAGNYTDFVGNVGSSQEFGFLMELAGEERSVDNQLTRVLTRETLEEFYQGDLFFNIEKKLAAASAESTKSEL